MLHPAARIARHTFVDGLTGCRLWVGDGLDPGGYPRIAVRFPDGRERPVTVARVVECSTAGDPPRGTVVRHRGDQPPCPRPEPTRLQMRRHAARAKIPGPGRSRGRADPQPPDAAGPGGPAEDAASGTPATKQPDAAAVGRALRAMRDVLDGMAIPGEPSRCTLVLVDDIIPLLDRAIELLEGPPARVA